MPEKIIYIVTFAIILCLFSFDLCFPQTALRLTDEDKIKIAVESIRRGIQKEKMDMILEVCSDQIKIKGNIIQANELKEELNLVFANSSNRITTIGPPSDSGFTDLWDFDIIGLSLSIKGDSAEVNCKLVFWAAKPMQETPRTLTGRKINEEFVFKKTGEMWQLAGVNNFLDFLQTYGEIEKVDRRPNKNLDSNKK